MSTNRTPRRPEAQTRAVAALALSMLLASLGISIATVALPTLADAFSAPLSSVQWVVLAYLLSVTVAIVSGGRMGDLLGHRRVLLAGLVIFAAASALCAAAPTLGVLIAARAAQGVGGAILLALPISIARETVAAERTGAAMGLMATMSAIGTALGPSLGGVAIDWLGWQAPFVALAGFSLVVLVLALRAIPATPASIRRQRTPMDVAGSLVLALALSAYALSVTAAGDTIPVPRGLLLAVAAVGVGLFVAVERRAAAPLVHLAALRNRATAAGLVMNLLVSSGMMATLIVGPFYLTFTLGLSPAAVGLVMAVGPVVAALAGVPAGRITDRFGAPRVLVAGLLESSIGFVGLAILPHLLGLAGYILALALLTPGFQLFLAANNTAVMLTARPDQRGMVSGLLGLARNLGLMTGASLMGMVFTTVAATTDIAGAAPDTVGEAFTVTFLAAAAMVAVAIPAALAGRRAGPIVPAESENA